MREARLLGELAVAVVGQDDGDVEQGQDQSSPNRHDPAAGVVETIVHGGRSFRPRFTPADPNTVRFSNEQFKYC